ncbi:MAG: thioredoxin fold domain-containing protein [Ectothiorhodospiraceae bacterium]|nr:thioredoxin fold domain-containing protein [Ectothiorhodospiraceae bacterium]
MSLFGFTPQIPQRESRRFLDKLPCHVLISLTLLLLAIPASYAAGKSEGQFFGGKDTEYPAWFKDSFLDLRDDIKDATEDGKRFVIFFHQAGCPYCNALVERNFAQKDISEKAQKHFDIVAINMWGDRPVTHVDGTQYTEKTFAEALKVQFTPTVIFFDEAGKVALRVNGYHSPQRFNLDLDYVATRQETKVSYREFMKVNRPAVLSSKTLNPEAFFTKNEFDYAKKTGIKGRPFAVFFEQKDCPACDRLHRKVLPDKELLGVIKQFDVTQLDMWSKTPIVTPQGEKMTAREWAKKLDIKFAPSIIVFNTEGNEVIRSEASFKVFHTQGVLHYVLSEEYKKQPSFQRYLTGYADHLREQGRDVDIWRYANEKAGKK